MRPRLRILFAAGLLGLASRAAAQVPASANSQAAAEDPAPQLSALDAADQNSPETLNGRFAYAEHLMTLAGGDCLKRADAAQGQLDIVVAKPAFSVLMPLGAARAASLEYDIHSTRAGCGAEAPVQQSELRAARDAALRAVDLYRDGFDYQSMVVMQFDAAVADRQLGDPASAMARLRSAIEMDETYGFQNDAKDNGALLQQWMDDGSGSNREAEPAKIVPARSAALKFAWSARDADVTVAASYVAVIKDKVIHSQGAAQRTLSIRRDKSDWLMSFPSNKRNYGFDEWPQGYPKEELATLLLANIQMSSPGIRVDSAGDYKSLINPSKIPERLAAEASQMLKNLLPEGKDLASLLPRLDKDMKSLSTPDEIEAMAVENYDLLTAEWIGAKLDQGIWYDMTAPLRAPGTSDTIDHDIQFAYTRATPCTASSTSSSCIEIVLHATPNPDALGKWIAFMKAQLRLHSKKTIHYWAATDVRIVTDPNDLLIYVSDVRRSWYVFVDGDQRPVINSERILSTSNYN